MQYCINKYGNEKGKLIANGKVTIGMTKEMCKDAWGTPIDLHKTTTKIGTDEHWYYSWKYSLHFENGLLIRINN